MKLDDADHAILAVLRLDGRASMTTLAQTVHISRAGVHARVKRMTDAGVIRGFAVRTDPVLAGRHSSAYVALTIEQASWQLVRDSLAGLAEVEHMALVGGGEFDVLLLVRARDNRDLRRIVLEDIQAIPSVRSTRTLLIFEDFALPFSTPRATP